MIVEPRRGAGQIMRCLEATARWLILPGHEGQIIVQARGGKSVGILDHDLRPAAADAGDIGGAAGRYFLLSYRANVSAK